MQRATDSCGVAGMVLCASYEPEGGDKVCEPMAPPEGAAVGELITFEGHESNPDKVLKKSKVQFSVV